MARFFYSTIVAVRFALIIALLGFVIVYAGAPAFFGLVFVSAAAIAGVWLWAAIAFTVSWIINFFTFGLLKKISEKTKVEIVS
jgi:hypothetical protein